MKEEKAIVIDNFQAGVAPSVLSGLSTLVNLDTSVSGEIYTKKRIDNAASGSNVFMKWHTTISSNKYELGSNGKLYKNGIEIAGNTIDSTPIGNGMCYYNGYVYVSRAAAMDRLEVSTGAWTNSWGSFQSSSYNYYRQMLVGIDDILYVASSNYIATYDGSNWINNKCAIPAGDIVKSIAELGDYLYIGTWNPNTQRAKVYSWNRQSNFPETPTEICSGGVHTMIAQGGMLYILAGQDYGLYAFNGSQIKRIASFMDYFKQSPYASTPANVGNYKQSTSMLPVDPQDTIYPQAISTYNDKILLGLSISDVSIWSSYYPFGLWSYDTTNGAIQLEFLPSQTTYHSTDNYKNGEMYIGYIASTDTSVSFSYGVRDTLYTYKDCYVDTYSVNSLSFPTDHRSYFESALYQVGTTNKPRTFSRLKIQLANPMPTGCEIKTYYRFNTRDNWTLLDTFSEQSISKEIPFAVTSENLQIKATFKGNSGTGGVYGSPELKNITIS